MKKQAVLVLALSAAFSAPLYADGHKAKLKAEGKGVIQGFFKELKGELMKAKKAGGAVAAAGQPDCDHGHARGPETGR